MGSNPRGLLLGECNARKYNQRRKSYYLQPIRTVQGVKMAYPKAVSLCTQKARDFILKTHAYSYWGELSAHVDS